MIFYLECITSEWGAGTNDTVTFTHTCKNTTRTDPERLPSTKVPQPVHVSLRRNTGQCSSKPAVRKKKKHLMLIVFVMHNVFVGTHNCTFPCRPCLLHSMSACVQYWGCSNNHHERWSPEDTSEHSPSISTGKMILDLQLFSFHVLSQVNVHGLCWCCEAVVPDQLVPRLSRRHRCSERARW